MPKINMQELGFTDAFLRNEDSCKTLYVGRVLSQAKDLYRIITENGEIIGEVSGKFRFAVKRLTDFPAVGDFVMLDRNMNNAGHAIIHHVLTRKSAFIRKAAGKSNDEQVVAANIDTVFICMSLNKDFNLRRLERYLSIGWSSGALPVVVLTKADLCDQVEQLLAEVENICFGTEILVTSALHKDDYWQIMPYIQAGKTVAFIGSSGVGKSTLINCLLEEDKMSTNVLRNDDKGKHTTTRRELILLKNGGLVIDTPGMRELGLESADLAQAFSDIDQLASLCRFGNCTHTNEPDCAVQRAIHEGTLSLERLLSYQKLKKEIKYEGLDSRQIESLKINEMFSRFDGIKNAKKYIKRKNKQR